MQKIGWKCQFRLHAVGYQPYNCKTAIRIAWEKTQCITKTGLSYNKADVW